MFELPEYLTLSMQMNEAIVGKTIQRGELGNSPHKFVWYNRSRSEFAELTRGKQVGETTSKGKWLFIPLEPGFVLIHGEGGGKVLLHPKGSNLPAKYHLHLAFDDGSFLTATTQMWGAMELFEQGDELQREYIKGMNPTPTEPEFTFEYFSTLIDDVAAEKKRSVKGLLTQDQIIPGLGNAIAQDIMYLSRLHPRRSLDDLDVHLKRVLYDAIISTVVKVIERGGRYDEYNLHGNRGGYLRIMDKNALNRPCPGCKGEITRIQYLGGACYLCPNCQIE